MNTWDVRWPLMTLASLWPVAAPIETRLPPDPVIASVLHGAPLPDVSGNRAHQVIAPVAQVARATAVKSASADQTVSGGTQSAAATATKTASAEQMIAPLVQVITMREAAGGVADQAIAPVVQVVTATAVKVASADQAVTGVIHNTLATAVKLGAAAQVIAPLVQTVTMIDSARGSADQTIAPVVQVVMATAVASGSVDQAVAGVTQNVTATAVKVAAADQTAGGVSQSVIASAINQATADQAIAPLGQAVTATTVAHGMTTQPAAGLAQSAAGRSVGRGQASQTIGAMTCVSSGCAVGIGAASQSVAALIQAASGGAVDTPWTPANLAVTPYVILDADEITWSGSNFSALANTGSIGGTFGTRTGSPQKSAGDANGHDAVAFGGTSGIYLPNATTPTGNLFILYVSKRAGTQPAKWGVVAAQANALPGWYLADLVTQTGSFSDGHTYHNGDRVINGWPAGSSSTAYNIMVTPAAETGYNINALKAGTEHLWRVNGSALTPNYASDNSRAAVTAHMNFGVSDDGGFNSYWFANLAYLIIAKDPTSDEIEKLEGWAAWRFGTVDKLPSGHPYKSAPPVV